MVSIVARRPGDGHVRSHLQHADSYLLASVGERVDSSRAGRVITTRWVTPKPIRNASFNLGLFKDYTVAEAGIPLVTVMISEEAHKKLAREYRFLQQSKMRRRSEAM